MCARGSRLQVMSQLPLGEESELFAVSGGIDDAYLEREVAESGLVPRVESGGLEAGERGLRVLYCSDVQDDAASQGASLQLQGQPKRVLQMGRERYGRRANSKVPMSTM